MLKPYCLLQLFSREVIVGQSVDQTVTMRAVVSRASAHVKPVSTWWAGVYTTSMLPPETGHSGFLSDEDTEIVVVPELQDRQEPSHSEARSNACQCVAS